MTKVGRGWAAGGDTSRRKIGFDMAGKSRGLVLCVESILAILGLKRVDVNGSIGGLGRDVFVKRIPGNTLDVMTVLCDLAH